MKIKKISKLPKPPRRGDSNFAKTADKFLASLPRFVFQVNDLIDHLNVLSRKVRKEKR